MPSFIQVPASFLALTIASCITASLTTPGITVLFSGVAFSAGMTIIPGVPVSPSISARESLFAIRLSDWA